MNILVTGGCGFIGSHLVDKLVEEGHKVRVYDSLEKQVHRKGRPSFLNRHAEYIFADICNRDRLRKALKGIEVIFHQAAQVGIGQSMYRIGRYVLDNSYGTAVLLDLIVNTKNRLKKLIVASSMSIYGEGAYKCVRCGLVYPNPRPETQLKQKKWEMRCPGCRREVTPVPTKEDKPLSPASVYAITKRSQEELVLTVGGAYKIPVVALRYFNVYGPRQSLNNPYTGVVAIFLSRIKNNRPPLIFEDGRQSRDFVYVTDVVDANILAMKRKTADYECFNVATGKAHSILDVASTIASIYNKQISPKVLSAYRPGDIRHCYADITKISRLLRFKPKVTFREGIEKLIEWSKDVCSQDLTEKAYRELSKRGLIAF